MRRGGAFGAPKPLPGERGYKQRESDRLAEETRQMELNLLKLQKQMAQSRVERQQNPAGGRWRSAATNRGSLRKYGDSVRQGQHKRAANRSKGS